MRTLKSWSKRLAFVFGAKATRQDFDAELDSHLKMSIEDNLGVGMSLEEARRQSILKLGGLEQARQLYRERATIPLLETLLQDARFGWRILARRPGFALLVIVILALGIGANTAMFSIINAVLLRPLPYKNSDRLVLVWQTSNQHRTTGEWFDTYREFEDWQSHNRSFEKLAALSWAVGGKSLVWHGKRQEVLAIPTSADFFSMLGVGAAMGRTFAQADLYEGCSVVLSHALWQNVLGSPTGLPGENIRIDQSECRVVGVMPKDFSFYPTETALWTLITPNSAFVKDSWRSVTGVFGRLKPGITRSEAESELETLERNILSEAPPDLALPQAVPVVLDLQSEFTWLAGRNLQTALVALFVAVFFVLLIACVNVANLLLAQAADRHRELAVRASLGAGRGRLIRQLLIESTLLSSGGALFGMLLAFAAVRLFRAHTPVELPPGNPVEINWQVFVFTALLALVAAGLFGLVPAWRASCLDLNEALKEAGPAASQGRTARHAGFLLVACEVGLSVVLLVGAGLLLQSLSKLAATPLGFRTDHLLSGSVHLPETKYADPDQKIQFFDRLRDQLSSIPGVEGVSLGSSLYLRGSNALAVEGKTFARESAAHNVASEAVDNNFLEVMGIPLLRGRPFDTRDLRNARPVAIVNQALADQYFPGQDPIGQRIKLGSPERSEPWLTIVGVVVNVKTTSVFQEMGYVVLPAVYQPLTQQPTASMFLLVRTNNDPNALMYAVEQKVQGLDVDVTVANVKTMEDALFENQSQPRFRTILLSTFAMLALVLAALGIYGVLTQSVVRRTKEIGIRMALGATRGIVTQMVLKQAFSTVLAGVALGLVLVICLSRVIAQLLYMVSPYNCLTLIAVSALLMCVALLASFLPARRATAIDPIAALRNE